MIDRLRIKEKVNMRLKTDMSDLYNVGRNKMSPAGKSDKRNWYMCKLCDYSTLTAHGMKIHLTKRHNVTRKSATENIIDIVIDEVLKDYEV